jgi:hypothetical protein
MWMIQSTFPCVVKGSARPHSAPRPRPRRALRVQFSHGYVLPPGVLT